MKSHQLGEAGPLGADADDDELVHVVAIAARLVLPQPARVDADHVEQELDILRPALADDGEPHAARSPPHSPAARSTELVGRENAAEIGGDLVVRRGPIRALGRGCRSHGPAAPSVDELAKDLAIEADAAYL